jgi:uncharacterized membrane protein YgcG
MRGLDSRIAELERGNGAPLAVVVVPAGEDEDAAIERARATWEHEPELIVLIKRFATE